MVSIVIVICVLIGLYSFLLFHYYQAKQNLDRELLFLEQMREMRIKEEERLANLQDSSAFQKLEEAWLWLENIPLSTVLLLDTLTKLLPEHGYMVELTYMDQERVMLKIRFNQLSEVASYLHHLTATPLIKEAWLSNIKEQVTTKEFSTILNDSAVTLEANHPPNYFLADYELVIHPLEAAKRKGRD